jgi:hypothetical protein
MKQLLLTAVALAVLTGTSAAPVGLGNSGGRSMSKVSTPAVTHTQAAVPTKKPAAVRLSQVLEYLADFYKEQAISYDALSNYAAATNSPSLSTYQNLAGTFFSSYLNTLNQLQTELQAESKGG